MTVFQNLRSRVLFCLLIALPALVIPACTATAHSESGFETESYSTTWTPYRDPMGFSVDHPDDWDVEGDPETGQVSLYGPEDTEVVIWPVFIRRPIDSDEACSTQSALLSQLGYEKEEWATPRAVGPGAVRSVLESGAGERGVAVLTWVPTRAGTSCILYLVDGATDVPAPPDEMIARILSSFRLGGTGGPTGSDRAKRTDGQAGVSTFERGVTWTDPTERAFSAELPANWQASGGVVRPNSILTQAKIEAYSPDHGIYVYFGDTFPWFIEPHQFVGAGQVYRDPMGGSQPVCFYLPGSAFLTQYLLPRSHGQCTIVEETPMPQIADGLLRIGINEYQAGLVRYGFQQNGQTLRGSALCITERLRSGAFASWHVYRLALVEAVSGKIQEGEAALGRIVGSFRIDPQWLQREAVKAGVNSRTIAEMSQAISTTVSAAFENQQAGTEAALAKGAKARRGIEEVHDPLTDTTFEVSNGGNYYWIDHEGHIVGTETATIPSIDFRRMFILP